MKRKFKDLCCSDFDDCKYCPFGQHCYKFCFGNYDTFGEIVEEVKSIIFKINLEDEIEIEEEEEDEEDEV